MSHLVSEVLLTLTKLFLIQQFAGHLSKQAAAEMKTLEYGNTASLREVVDSCATLTNARLVRLIMEQYRLKSHLRLLKQFFLHGQVGVVDGVLYMMEGVDEKSGFKIVCVESARKA